LGRNQLPAGASLVPLELKKRAAIAVEKAGTDTEIARRAPE
jgi:hypothetical protein